MADRVPLISTLYHNGRSSQISGLCAQRCSARSGSTALILVKTSLPVLCEANLKPPVKIAFVTAGYAALALVLVAAGQGLRWRRASAPA